MFRPQILEETTIKNIYEDNRYKKKYRKYLR